MKKVRLLFLMVILSSCVIVTESSQAQIIGIAAGIARNAKWKKIKKETKLYISNASFEDSNPETTKDFGANDEMFVRTIFHTTKLYYKYVSIFAVLEKTGEKVFLADYRIQDRSESNIFDLNLKDGTNAGLKQLQIIFLQLDMGDNPVKIIATIDDEIIAETETNFIRKEGEIISVGLSFDDFQEGMSDKVLKAQTLDLMREVARKNGWKEEFKKTKIESEDWSIQYHSNSGAILGRTISFWAYATWPDGHCTVQSFYAKQQYNGTGYSKALKYAGLRSGSQKQIDCSKEK